MRSSRLAAADLVRVSLLGIGARKLRAALSVLGIAIGIAAIVCVLGISQSSAAGLQHELDRLGTNLLTVQPGKSLTGDQSTLPLSAEQTLTNAPYVQQVSGIAPVSGTVLRNKRIGSIITGGIGIKAARPNLPSALHGKVAQGVFLNAATSNYPVTVLGAVAAQRLGITTLRPDTAVRVGGKTFTVVGILAPIELAPDIDRSALIGFAEAERAFRIDGSAATVYLRTDPEHVGEAAKTLAAAANPAHPDLVSVSQPSAALSAQLAAKKTFNSLLLGLGAVAVLVGAIGIANVMVISVLERRSEIGLRRALGATRGHIGGQFVGESLALALLGGLAGCALGTLVTVGYAQYKHWEAVIPATALPLGLAGTLLIGTIAGLYPAARAARLSPTQALAR
jgi:putative ABC transport system permease protein